MYCRPRRKTCSSYPETTFVKKSIAPAVAFEVFRRSMITEVLLLVEEIGPGYNRVSSAACYNACENEDEP